MMKTIFFGILTLSILGSFATATQTENPEIESVNPWPDNLDHGEQLYVDVEVSNGHTVEDAWYVVHSDGERLKSGPLTDSNEDGYYVSPVAFKAEGGNTYEVTAKIADKQGSLDSQKVEIESECGLSLAQKCFY